MWFILKKKRVEYLSHIRCFVLVALPEHLADLWLESVAKGTMHHYTEQILKIQVLSNMAVKQLGTDIG